MLATRTHLATACQSAVICLALATLSACAGNGSAVDAPRGLPNGIVLPFPSNSGTGIAATGSPRQSSVAAQFIVDGNDTSSVFGDAQENGTILILTAPANSFAAAIYGFDLTGNTLLSADINYSVSGGEAYFGFADFDSGTWQIEGPQASNPPEIDLTSGNHATEGGIFYFFVLAFDGAVVTVTNTSVQADVAGGGGPPWTLSGNIVDDLTQPVDAVTIHVPFRSSIAISTDALGDYLSNVATNDAYTLVPDKSGFVFTPNITTVAITADTVQDFTAQAVTLPDTVSYAQHMRPWVFEPVCMNCHNSSLSGSQRHGAPSDVNWDTYDGTTLTKKQHGTARVQVDSMPAPALGWHLNDFQKALFQKWEDGGFQP